MKKTKLLFKIGFIYHKAAFDPIIDLFLKDKKYDVYFSLDQEIKRKFFLNIKHRPPMVDELVRQGYRFTEEKKGFDIVLAGDTLRDVYDYGKTLMCFLNHGTGIKNILYRNLKKHPPSKYQIFVEGQYRVDKLNESGVLGDSEVHLIGLPKLDFYFNQVYQRKKVLQELGLDPDKPTVLFAPTYKPTCLYDVKDAIFEATKDDYNLIIKLHHYSWMGKYAPHKQHEIYERRVPQFPHSRLIPMEKYNIIPYMTAADTLLSEASSTVFDFLALSKTGVIYDLPCDKLNHTDGQALLTEDNREFLKDSFVHIQNPEELKEGIKKALSPDDSMREKADEERRYFFHQLDGKASIRFKEKIEELYEEGGHLTDPADYQ